MNKKAKEWLEQAKKHYNTSNDKAAISAALIAIAEVLMDDKEDPKQDKKLKTEYKDPLFKDKKDDDQQQPQDQPE